MDIIDYTKEEATLDFCVKKMTPVTIVAGGLSGSEQVTFQILAKEGTWIDVYDASGLDFLKLIALGNVIGILSPGEYRLLKPITTNLVIVSVIRSSV